MSIFTTYDLLAANLPARAEHPAVVHGEESVTYAQLAERVERLAARLHEIGVRRGDRVGVMLNKSIEEVVATFAVTRLGAVFVNIFSQATRQQVEYIIDDCAVKVLIADARQAKPFAAGDFPDSLTHIVVKGKTPDHPAMGAWPDARNEKAAPPADPPPPPAIDHDLAAILYTSGSTGAPKGVMFTHLNVVAGARIVAKYLNNTPDDRILSLLPFSFDYGLNQLMTSCLLGATLVLHGVMMPAEIAKTLVAQRVTGFAAVAPVWVQVVRYMVEEPKPLPDLRYVTNSGGAIPPNILDAMPEVFPGVEVYLMYGLTEAFRSTFLPPHLYDEKRGAMGWAIPNQEVYVIDEDAGRVCGPGEMGELVHRGSLVSQGYWGKPQITAEKIRPCPALRDRIGDEKVCFSGDIVRLDEDGCLWFVGRRDGLIKSRSVRISPTEIEDIVYQSKLVDDVIAFGVKDDELGQAIHLAVSSGGDEPVDVDAVLAYCRRAMPPYMLPTAIHPWPGKMPRTSNGKLNRPAVIKACTQGNPANESTKEKVTPARS